MLSEIVIGLCATRNLYPELMSTLNMLISTQNHLSRIHVFTEDDLEWKYDNTDIQIINHNVCNFEPIINNQLNSNTHWTYMTLTRCYFADLLPEESKILYLDLDIIVKGDLLDLWNQEMQSYAAAGVIDHGIQAFNAPLYSFYPHYINTGILLLNLQFIRDNQLNMSLHQYLNRFKLSFPDQDAYNMVCDKAIKILSPIWNSSPVTQEVDDAVIIHCVRVKPWEPTSPYFKQWLSYYLGVKIN